MIDFISISELLKIVPKKYWTNNIKIAKGKYKMVTTVKELVKKVKNG